MSKSLGNFFRIRDVLMSGQLRDPEVLALTVELPTIEPTCSACTT